MWRGKGNSVIMKIIDLVVIIISLAAMAALIASYIAPYINPNIIWYFAFFGLFAPIIYIVNFILVLYWACRWSPMFFVCGTVLLAGICNISTFYRTPLSKSYAPIEKNSKSIKIFSFNVEGFIALNDEGKSYSNTKEILDYIKEINPDIICFQEYQSTRLFSQKMIDKTLSEWKYKCINYSIAGILGCATYSKFPIVSSNIIKFDQSNNGVVYANILIAKKDTLRVINNHLETTYVDKGNIAFLDYHNFPKAEDKKGEIKQIGKRLKKGFTKRAIQADSVARLIAESNLQTIVCGDFNDTPVSYVYKTVRGDYEDAFENKGSGLGYTYKRLYHLLRIDYILHSNGIETISYESPNVKWSDHNPIMATLKVLP